jgi:hypothetical protein
VRKATIRDVHLMCDPEGDWWWFESAHGVDSMAALRSGAMLHGPFESERQADRDSQVTLFGSDVEVTDRGMWDPKWDEKQ